mgnify:FL=1
MPEKTAQKEPGKKLAPSKKPKPQQEVVIQIPLSELHPSPDHPFQVREESESNLIHSPSEPLAKSKAFSYALTRV